MTLLNANVRLSTFNFVPFNNSPFPIQDISKFKGRKKMESMLSKPSISRSTILGRFQVLNSSATTKYSRTKEIMEKLPESSEAGGAGGASSYDALLRMDSNWRKLRNTKSGSEGPPPKFVDRISRKFQASEKEEVPEFDVVVCGGTLGVFVAAALIKKGEKVAIVERGKLQGRSQEWNISRKELLEIVDLGIISEEEMEDCISVEFNPNRCVFHGGKEVWVKDVLNLGISPQKLIETVKNKFESMGGKVYEGVSLTKVDIHDDVAVLNFDGHRRIKARLLVDAMGNFSPIVRQIRWGQKPDGICLVVGSCARGFPKNSSSDIIATVGPLSQKGNSPAQYFWEAFPAGSGPLDRTTYLFTYLDAHPERFGLQDLLEDYWELMPEYQGVKLEELEFLRVLFGFFPTYRDSPLQPAFDRVIQVGDASGIQSPLSFGGFGSITRHLERISAGLEEALNLNLLNKESLALINPYQPNLSGAWLFQRAMSARVNSNPSLDFINQLLSTNFEAMEKLGDPVLKPFLQDVTQFGPLASTMAAMMVTRPDLLPSIFASVGFGPLVDWLSHFLALGTYTALSSTAAPALRPWVQSLPPDEGYAWRRRLEAWKYGSGLDYKL